MNCRTPSPTLFPYTTLFRSCQRRRGCEIRHKVGRAHRIRPAPAGGGAAADGHGPPLPPRSEEHTSELQSLAYLVCRFLHEKKTSALLALTEDDFDLLTTNNV